MVLVGQQYSLKTRGNGIGGKTRGNAAWNLSAIRREKYGVPNNVRLWQQPETSLKP